MLIIWERQSDGTWEPLLKADDPAQADRYLEQWHHPGGRHGLTGELVALPAGEHPAEPLPTV